MRGIERFIKRMKDVDGRTIRVDVHEPSKVVNVLKEIAPKYNMDVEMAVLQTGDYAYRNIGIERKDKDFIKVPDVLAKAEELHRAYDKAYLMTSQSLEKVLEDDEYYHAGKWNESIKGLTASLVARGVEPIFCPSEEVMFEVMCKMFDKLTDAKDRNIEQPIRPKPKREDWQLYIISSLPNVGEVTAIKMLAHFGSVRKIFNATTEELKEVDGIGSTIANKIDEVLRGDGEK